MEGLTKLVVKLGEYRRAQTMTEYALILSAVAVVVFLGYQTMGGKITALIGGVDAQL